MTTTTKTKPTAADAFRQKQHAKLADALGTIRGLAGRCDEPGRKGDTEALGDALELLGRPVDWFDRLCNVVRSDLAAQRKLDALPKARERRTACERQRLSLMRKIGEVQAKLSDVEREIRKDDDAIAAESVIVERRKKSRNRNPALYAANVEYQARLIAEVERHAVGSPAYHAAMTALTAPAREAARQRSRDQLRDYLEAGDQRDAAAEPDTRPKRIVKNQPGIGPTVVGYEEGEDPIENVENVGFALGGVPGEIANVPGKGFVIPAGNTGTDDETGEA